MSQPERGKSQSNNNFIPQESPLPEQSDVDRLGPTLIVPDVIGMFLQIRSENRCENRRFSHVDRRTVKTHSPLTYRIGTFYTGSDG